jgi:hypothetical protein
MVLKDNPAFDLKTLDRPWVCFLLFSFSNALLAYGTWSLTAQLLIAFYGLLLPAALFFLGRVGRPVQKFPNLDFSPTETRLLSPPNALLWCIFGILFFLTRFYHIGSNPLWPIKDVGHFGILGLSLSQKWDWRLLWGEFQAEPLYLWGLGLFFKCFEPSNFSVRIFPALISIMTIGLAYGAARQAFSKGLSLLAVCFFTFSFGNWVFSRTGMGPVTVLPMEFLVLGLLGYGLKTGFRTPKGEFCNLFILGSSVGFGFYTYTVWPVVFLSISAAVLLRVSSGRSRLTGNIIYLVSALGVAFPIILARMGQNGLAHVQGEFGGLPFSQSLPGYINLLFFNGTGNQPAGPAWGGMFNPFETGLMEMGMIVLISNFQSGFSKWFFLSFGLFLLPGIFSNGVILYRVIQILPLLLFPILAGITELLAKLPSPRRWGMAILILSVSSLLNAYHWCIPYQDWKSVPAGKGDWISGEYARAYALLSEVSRRDGPLYLFSEFDLDTFDKTLNLFCFPFDALQNPKLTGSNPRWAALLVNKYYVPFLQKRFPQSRWEILKKDPLPNNLNLALGLIPVSSMDAESLEDWKKADRICRDLNLEIKRTGPPVRWEKFRAELQLAFPSFARDPFLRSIFWEKLGMFDAILSRYPDCVRDLETALRSGYPTAHLLYNLSKARDLADPSTDSGKSVEKPTTPIP